MKAIRQRVCLFSITSGSGVFITIFISYQDSMIQTLLTKSLLILTILVTVILFGFLIREYGNHKTARLIIENEILHIHPAKIGTSICNESDTSLLNEGIEVFISCFGILLNSKIIKFNLDGIHLKAVEIGREFIYLTYGKDTQIQKVQVIHSVIDHHELQSIIEKFRYETGVVPVITDS